VNDRGPFIEGRILDLSFAAALELEMVQAGTMKVMIEIVEEAE
jgi:rare lipoprotein A